MVDDLVFERLLLDQLLWLAAPLLIILLGLRLHYFRAGDDLFGLDQQDPVFVSYRNVLLVSLGQSV